MAPVTTITVLHRSSFGRRQERLDAGVIVPRLIDPSARILYDVAQSYRVGGDEFSKALRSAADDVCPPSLKTLLHLRLTKSFHELCVQFVNHRRRCPCRC